MQEVEQDRHRTVLGPASLNYVAWQSDPKLPSPEGSGSSLPHLYFSLPRKLKDKMGNNPTFQGEHETRGFFLISVIYKGK
uniref:Uncharacterized protein n=1 Tax=Microcebus murinus TaxID=30608 RepID=A0A8C5YHW1_MICMU